MSSIAFRIPRGLARIVAGLATALISAASLSAQMVSPSIDQPGQPFSYFSKPTDEIGVMGAEAATEITPEGYLRTGFGELMFFAGPELEPTSVRIRTLEQGHLPIVHYEFERDGIVYRFTLFAATLNGKDNGPLVNFIRVEMTERLAPAHARHLCHRHPLRRAPHHRRAARRQPLPAPRGRTIPRSLPPDRRALQQPVDELL